MSLLDKLDELAGVPVLPSEEAMGGAFEATDRFDRQIGLWSPPLRVADDFVLPEKDGLEARAHDLLRNDNLVQAGVQLHKDNVIGASYRLVARPHYAMLGLDEVWAQEFQEEVEAKFTLWAESPQAWADASRATTFTGLLRLAVGVYLISGEMLATLEWMDDTRPYHTAMRLIEIARLRTPFIMAHDDRVRGGIRFSRSGVPLTFYIHDSISPHRSFTGRSAGKGYVAVPYRTQWGRQRVIYLREQLRPEQSRGVSQLVSILKHTKTLSKFRDVTLQNAVVNASFAATIESDLPTDAVFTSLGGGNIEDRALRYAQRYLSAVSEYLKGSRNTVIDGVKIPHLFPGTKLNLKTLGEPGGVGQDFEASLIRHVATTLGVPYESLAKDHADANYSSLRAAIAETRRYMLGRKRMVADRIAGLFYRAWFEEAANLPPSRGGLETMRGRRVPSIYEGMNFEAYTRCDWIGASEDLIDPLKESQAAVLRVKYGLSTRARELAKLGMDWREVFEQQRAEQELAAKLGLSFGEGDTNMMNAATGAPREVEDIDGRSAVDEQRGDFKEDG